MKSNSGFFLKRLDSINLGLSVVMIFGALITFIDLLYGRTSIYYFCQFLYLLFFINAIPAIIRNFSKKAFWVCSMVAVFFFISKYFSSNLSVFEEAQRSIYLWSFPYFLLSACVINFESLFILLRRTALIVMCISILELFLVYAAGAFSYSQELGYQVLPTLTLYLLSFFNERKSIYLVPVVFSIIISLASGSRGPLLCIGLFVLLSFIVYYGISKKLIIISLLLILAYFVFSNVLFKLLGDSISFFTNSNFSTRSIELLLSGEIGEDSDRDLLRKVAINYIKEHPFIGSGVINDRIIIAQALGNSGDEIYGSYCHNFFLELMMQFGFIPGVFIICIFFKKVVGQFKYKKKYSTFMLLTALGIGLFPLLVSRSWITFSQFYFLVGVLVSFDNIKKNGQIN